MHSSYQMKKDVSIFMIEYVFFPISEQDFRTLQSKYIVPLSANKWVMQSIRDSWGVFKMSNKEG